MKTTIEHLPEQKRHQLSRAMAIILEMAEPDMIILYGSHARGDWQEELAPDGINYQYQSDFDLLLVVRSEPQAFRIDRMDKLRTRLVHEIATPVSLLAEDIGHINGSLEKSRYFYVDILNEGIVLHDSGKLELIAPVELQAPERKMLAQEDYDHWYAKAKSMLRTAGLCVLDGNLNDAAFMLHQTVERAYAAILLVYTSYKPRTHDLLALGERIAAVEPQFSAVFPRSNEEEQCRFERLRTAYVDARYLKAYTISADDIEWLSQRVEVLLELTTRLCRERIASIA